MVYLHDDKYVVRIGDIVLESHPTGVPKYQLVDDMCSGWWDSAGVKRNKISRATHWGDFRTETLRDARYITWTGVAVSSTKYELQAMRDEFTGVLATNQSAIMTVYSDSTGNRYSEVFLEDKPKWTRMTDTTAGFQLELYAPNPRIYGEEKTVSILENDGFGGLQFRIDYPLNYNITAEPTSQVVSNMGNTYAYPTIEVSGHFPAGFKLTDGNNRWIVFPGAISPYSPLSIDTRTGIATQSGIDKSSIMEMQSFVVPPLEQLSPKIYSLANTSGGNCIISLRDTYI